MSHPIYQIQITNFILLHFKFPIRSHSINLINLVKLKVKTLKTYEAGRKCLTYSTCLNTLSSYFPAYKQIFYSYVSNVSSNVSFILLNFLQFDLRIFVKLVH